jgi:hypothetical protein
MLPVKVQIKFAKALLGVNKQAVNFAVLGELGKNWFNTCFKKFEMG